MRFSLSPNRNEMAESWGCIVVSMTRAKTRLQIRVDSPLLTAWAPKQPGRIEKRVNVDALRLKSNLLKIVSTA
jgi:hypothetical protein